MSKRVTVALVSSMLATTLLSPALVKATEQISERRPIEAPASEAWERVGNFFGLADWHPSFESSSYSGEGLQRLIKLGDGTEFTETLLTYDAENYRYHYRVNDPSPLPFRSYRGTIHIDPAGDQSTIVWSATYTSTGDSEEVRQMLKQLFNAGFDALESELEER